MESSQNGQRSKIAKLTDCSLQQKVSFNPIPINFYRVWQTFLHDYDIYPVFPQFSSICSPQPHFTQLIIKFNLIWFSAQCVLSYSSLHWLACECKQSLWRFVDKKNFPPFYFSPDKFSAIFVTDYRFQKHKFHGHYFVINWC